MGLCKSKETEPFPKQYPKFIEALNSYNFWVCEVMMPVAFQWIQEHHDEVYEGVAEEHKGDMGVVMAAAFQLVQELPSYKHWMDVYRNYEAAVTAGTWDPTEINPVWTKIVKQVRADTERAFASEEKVLKDTIR
jgi:hypothetical protein